MEEYAQCSGYSYFGSRQDGAWAEYLVVPVWNLVPFDDTLDYKTAALCEPAAVSMHAVNIGDIKEGQNRYNRLYDSPLCKRENKDW